MSTTLTERQREIKVLLDQGFGASKIADELGISRNAVHQQIQRMRRNGVLPADFTPSGAPTREKRPGEDLLRQIVPSALDADSEEGAFEVRYAVAALANEIRATRDELDKIARRLSLIVPR